MENITCKNCSHEFEVDRDILPPMKADCVFTDPPYNVNYSYDKYEDIHRGRVRKFADNSHIFNDDKTPAEFEEWLGKAFKNLYEFSIESAPAYICFSTSTWPQFSNALKKTGWHESQIIVWLKERLILSVGQEFHRIYEPIIYAWKEGQKRFSNRFLTSETEVWDLDRITFEEHLDVWKIQRDKSIDYRHPTQKPVRLAGRALRKSCPPEGGVLDLFGGSGSTLIAAEQMGNTAYLCELDPVYCDVIRERWEAYNKTTQ